MMMRELNTPRVQVHIGGTTRSGKTTLGNNLCKALKELGHTGILLDIDHTRSLTFGKDEPILGTFSPDANAEGKKNFQLQKQMQGWSYNNLFFVQIPIVSLAGAIPIVTATHGRVGFYDDAQRTANELGNQLRFIILEDPGLKEVGRRCLRDTESKSDMHNPLNNHIERDNYESISRRIQEAFGSFERPLCMIRQGTPEEMTQHALTYILDGMAGG